MFKEFCKTQKTIINFWI